MKIAIISDIHDNLPNLKKVLDYCASNKIEKIICCGDLASLKTLDYLNDNFRSPASEPIYYAFGNMEDGYLINYPFDNNHYKQTKIFKNFGEAEIGNNKISFVHKPEEAEELCQSGKYNYVFYGHTHKPWTDKKNNCTMLNPGNIANQFYPPTFAVWETDDDKFELVRINKLK